MMLETRHSVREILSRQPLFRLLGGTELDQLARGTREYRLAKNELLAEKGMHLLVAGQIKLFLLSAAGSEKIVSMIGQGKTFGEEEVFLNKPSPVTAQATRDSTLLILERQALMGALERNCHLSTALMARMCTRLCELIDNLETCVQRSSAQRVAYYLSQQAPEGAECHELQLAVNKKSIASQLSLAPETFSRVLKRLSKDGFLEIRGSCLSLKNLSTLRSYAG
jgi:CRP-like cAMP-binding protein